MLLRKGSGRGTAPAEPPLALPAVHTVGACMHAALLCHSGWMEPIGLHRQRVDLSHALECTHLHTCVDAFLTVSGRSWTVLNVNYSP